MAKEWWDFIVNVNTLNSDHASLLYSLANLCPSFNYFLQTRDKELQVIIKKRPVVKPRIFSGTERLDTTPEPIVPKQLPLVTRRNSANELVKILNELYPNENNTRNKQPRSYGPASKQKKAPGPAKKNAVINNIPGEVFKKTSPVQATLGRSPLLKSLLADESQKENAHITNIKKVPQVLSMPILIEDDETFPKAVLSNTNYDLNQNRLNQSPRKVKKIIKVKKKRYVYSNSLTDSKNRLKFILEEETPELSLKLIKKYRIKKCTIDVVRLKDSVLRYYEDLRQRNYEKLRLSLEESSNLIPNEEVKFTVSRLNVEQSSSLVPNEEMKSSASEVTDQLSNSNVDTNPPPADLLSGKDEEVSEKNVSTNISKENTSVVEKLDPKELKNMYCHGGIVPLGKLLMSDKLGSNNKHFLSLKEKKLRDISNDAAIFLKPKDASPKVENSEVDTKNLFPKNTPPDHDKLNSSESSAKENPLVKGDKLDNCNGKAVMDDNSSNGDHQEAETVLEEIRKSPNLESQNPNISSVVPSDATDLANSEMNESIVLNAPKNTSNIDYDTFEPTMINSNGNITTVSETNYNEEPVINGEEHLNVNSTELTSSCDISDEAERSEGAPAIEKLMNDNTETPSDSLVKTVEDRTILEKLINDTLSRTAEESEPLAKRPRIEINLSEMKLVTDIAKAVVESDKNEDRVCNMCKLSFESVESWNEHFENKVPKCTPNLQVTWENPEHSLLTD